MASAREIALANGIKSYWNGYDKVQADAKAHIAKWLGGTKKTVPIEYQMPSWKCERYYLTMVSEIYGVTRSSSLSELLKYLFYHRRFGVIANKTHLTNSDCEQYGIEKYGDGQKFTKVLRQILVKRYPDDKVVYNGKELSFAQLVENKMSEWYQSISGGGFLTLSVEFADFLTMSQNASGWSSCHNYGGIHAGGCISYALDPVSIVCYVHSGKEVIIGGEVGSYQHNSKQWRMMAYVDIENDIYLFSRQYPYACEGYSDAVKEIIKGLVGKPMRELSAHQAQGITEPDRDSLHCDDIGYSGDASGLILEDADYCDLPTLVVGTTALCLECGREYYEEDQWCCEDHAPARITCCCCDSVGTEEDMVSHNGDWFCEDCFHEHYALCDICEEYEPRDDMTYISATNQNVCSYCFNSKFIMCEYCGEYEYKDDAIKVDGDWYCEGCFNDHFSECTRCGSLHLNDDMTEHDDGLYCEWCYDLVMEESA